MSIIRVSNETLLTRVFFFLLVMTLFKSSSRNVHSRLPRTSLEVLQNLSMSGEKMRKASVYLIWRVGHLCASACVCTRVLFRACAWPCVHACVRSSVCACARIRGEKERKKRGKREKKHHVAISRDLYGENKICIIRFVVRYPRTWIIQWRY